MPCPRGNLTQNSTFEAVKASSKARFRPSSMRASLDTLLALPALRLAGAREASVVPIHLQPAYNDLGYARGDFPVAEQAAAEVLSLPMFPELTDEQIESIARSSVPGS